MFKFKVIRLTLLSLLSFLLSSSALGDTGMTITCGIWQYKANAAEGQFRPSTLLTVNSQQKSTYHDDAGFGRIYFNTSSKPKKIGKGYFPVPARSIEFWTGGPDQHPFALFLLEDVLKNGLATGQEIELMDGSKIQPRCIVTQ